LLRPTASVNRDEDSTTRQAAQGGVWKAEWNSVAGQRLFFELLGGQFIAGRHERPTFFDLFVLVANAGDADAEVEATYLLPDGATVKKSYTIAAGRRSTIHVDLEDAKLSDTAVSTTVRSVNDVPIVVERAMWWPDGGWSEGHSSAGVTTTGTAWAIADGEVGGARDVDTYILVANTSETTGAVKVTLLFEDGTSVDKLFTVSGRSRFNVDVRDQFPAAVNRRFGALVESQGSAPVHLVVERSMYWNASGQFWAAGTNALATRLQ
jgi:hypothetical protein